MDDDFLGYGHPAGDERFFRNVIDNLTEGVYTLDRERRITYWNRGAELLTGYAAADVLGRCCADGFLRHMDAEGRLLCHSGCPMQATMDDGEERYAELFLHHKMGHRVPINVRAIPTRAPDGTIGGAGEGFNDISARVLAEEKIRELERLSLVDPLTGVANRRYAEIQVASRLAEKTRYALPVGLLFLDVDHFKSVNDLFSHAVGDEVLAVIGRTLTAASRSGDFVCRWGGEEFIVLVAGLEPELLARAAERVRNLVANSSVPSVPDLAITVSIGATAAREDDTPESFVARADALMYAAKRAGRNRVEADDDGSQFLSERHGAE